VCVSCGQLRYRGPNCKIAHVDVVRRRPNQPQAYSIADKAGPGMVDQGIAPLAWLLWARCAGL
jgi:hypothetical protein